MDLGRYSYQRELGKVGDPDGVLVLIEEDGGRTELCPPAH